MTASEAQLRANKRYKEKQRKTGKLKFIQVEFNATELGLYQHAKNQRPTAAYIKRLIREDMEKGSGNS